MLKWTRQNLTLVSLSASALVLLSACGGSDSRAPVQLDKANMEFAARKANDSFVLFDLAIFAGDYMLWGNDWFENGKAYRCQADDAQSGTVSFTSNRPGGVFQAGDVLTVKYDNCQQDKSDPARSTGSLVLHVLAVTGDPASTELNKPWSYQAKVQFQALTVLSPNERSVVDGEMLVTERSDGVLNADLDERITTAFETTSMRLSEDADTHLYTKASGTLLSNYTAEDNWTATINTELESSTLSGRLSFSTVEPFGGQLGNPFPSQGVGRINGAESQQLKLRAQPLGVQGELTTSQAKENFFIDWANY